MNEMNEMNACPTLEAVIPFLENKELFVVVSGYTNGTSIMLGWGARWVAVG